MRRFVWSFVLLGMAGCPQPSDSTPQIEVNKRAAGMLDMIGSRSGKRAPRSTTKARVHVMKAGEELIGANATGKPGDLVLENDEVVFVVDALGVGFGFAQSGGNIIDAADAKERRDELGQMFTYFGSFPRQAVYSKLDFKELPDGKAVVTATGVELHEEKVQVTTTYTLAPGDRAVLVETSLVNGGDKSVTFGLGDAFQWGDSEKVIPGKPFGFGGKSVTPYIGGVGRFTSYAITSTEGEMPALSGGSWSDTEQKKDVAIAPKGKASYARVFAIGERPDSASLVAELVRASAGELGGIEIQLVDAKGAAVAAPPGAKVSLSTTKDGPEAIAIVAHGGKIEADVPPAKWFASYASSAGRKGISARVELDVKKDLATTAKLGVSDAGAIEVGCRVDQARVPCKVAVEGLDGTPDPDFGIGHVAAAARQYLFAATANASAPLAPGKYRLTATRGVEYGAVVQEVTIAGNGKFEFDLKRVLDTKGWMGADFHQHTLVGGDAPVARADRVKANACEGVELAVASEHNVISPLAPTASELGLSAFVVEITGEEITTDADATPWGHANAFPMPYDATKARGGSILPFKLSAKEVFRMARSLPGKRVIQVNHPRSGDNGYFDLNAFDAKTGVGTRAGYDDSFDSIEVWNSRSVKQRTQTLEDYLVLLRTRHPVTAVGNTDTHGVVGQEPGSPRTWVKVKDDEHLDAWDAARSDDLVDAIRVRRETIVSNGPFLSFDGLGHVLKAKGGKLDVKVRVQAAPFVEVQTVVLRLASGEAVPEQKVVMKPNAAGAMEAEVTFSLTVKADDAFVVVASGTKPLRPMISGKDEEIAPWAMTSATWIDFDGDGKSLGR